METYDYHADKGVEFFNIIDNLNNKEIEKANDLILGMKETTRIENLKHCLEWFNNAVLVILKDFSEMTSSILTIDRDKIPIIIVTIKNEFGIDITENCKCMKMILQFAQHIAVTIENKCLLFTLIFDCRYFCE